MTAFVHPQALCESNDIGEGTRIWAFAHVLPGARIGADCNICDGVFIESDVTVGDRVTVKCGVQLWDGVHLDDDVFVGPNATFTNDPFPRSKAYPESFGTTRVGKGASLGANCVILPGLTIGRSAMIGAGAVVTRDVPANAIVRGNPARIVGYVGDERRPATAVIEPAQPGPLGIGGSELITLNRVNDMRGALIATEFDNSLPFVPQRFFTVFDVPTTDVRGEHAHRTCEQLLFCLHGSVACIVDDGARRKEVVLDRPELALYMPAMVWGTQYKYSADSVLGVFASQPYDGSDYIRTYDEFLRERFIED